MIFRTVRMYGRAILTLLFIVVVGIASIQTIRANRYYAISEEYYRKIARMEEAARLTEELRQINAILTKERDDLLRELRDVQSYDSPIPDDIRGIIERVQ